MADAPEGTGKSTVVVVGDNNEQKGQTIGGAGAAGATDPVQKDGQSKKIHKLSHCMLCLKTLFVILGIIAVIVALVLIIMSVLTSIATKSYDADQSSRIAAMLLLAVTAAITICVVIYGEVAMFKKNSKALKIANISLVVLAIIQMLIGGIAINVDAGDKANLLKSLQVSFQLARQDRAKHYKIWSTTQADLECCGLESSDDYRNPRLPFYFPPDIPISCCPTYDPNRSDLVQEKERELCKTRHSYYKHGCKEPILTVFTQSANIVLNVTIVMVVVEVLVLVIGAIVNRILRKMKN